MKAARVDANQADIVAALRAIGASVQCLHTVGMGVPDLLVGLRRVNVLLEVKTARGRLNKREREWHRDWLGQVHVVRNVEEAIAVVVAVSEGAE